MKQNIASVQSGIAACMNKGLLLLAGGALAWSCLSNAAQAAQPPSPAQDVRADSGGRAIDPLRQRFEALGKGQLEQVYLQCSREALQRALGHGEAAFCSTAYDVLLKVHFGGDFAALLAWSRQQPDERIEPSSASAPRQAQQRAPRRIDWY